VTTAVDSDPIEENDPVDYKLELVVVPVSNGFFRERGFRDVTIRMALDE
jgi:hypothetical protein